MTTSIEVKQKRIMLKAYKDDAEACLKTAKSALAKGDTDNAAFFCLYGLLAAEKYKRLKNDLRNIRRKQPEIQRQINANDRLQSGSYLLGSGINLYASIR